MLRRHCVVLLALPLAAGFAPRARAPPPRRAARLAPRAALGEGLSDSLYGAQLGAAGAVDALAGGSGSALELASPAALALVFGAGAVTALSPCALSWPSRGAL